MKLIMLMVMLLPLVAEAQSVIPQAVREPINLGSRVLRGDTQKMKLQVEYLFVDTLGFPSGIKKSSIDFSLFCLANSPDSGVVQQLTIDELRVGTISSVGVAMGGARVVEPFGGLNFTTHYRSTIPIKDDCYDYDIRLGPEQYSQEGYDMLDQLITLKLIEQVRLTAARRLSYLGDTTTIQFPKPICFTMPEVINKYNLDLSPFTVKLTGITNINGTPCAMLSFLADYSYLQVEIYSTPKTSIKAQGSSFLSGDLWVSLSKGAIVKALFRDRQDARIDLPDGTVRWNRVWKTYNLNQK
jgi:hypothetical protein